MRKYLIPVALAALLPPAMGGAEEIRPLFNQPIPSDGAREMKAVRVEFAPGAVSNPHRHGTALVFAYVLSGAVESQLEGEAPRIYQTGESWSEPPGAHHLLTRNASDSKPASLLVVFIARPGEPIKTDDASTTVHD